MLKALRRATILGSSMALTAGLVLSSSSSFAADGGAPAITYPAVLETTKIPVPARISRSNLWQK